MNNDWEKEFDSMCEEFYFAPGGSDLRVKTHPSKVKAFISNLIAKERKAERERVIEEIELREMD